MSAQTPSDSLQLPAILSDFNARGWSGAPSDNCFYVLDDKRLKELTSQNTFRVFAYMDEGDAQFVGVAADLELNQGSWRARPISQEYIHGTLSELALN